MQTAIPPRFTFFIRRFEDFMMFGAYFASLS